MTALQPPPHISLDHYRYVIDSIDEAVFALEMDGNVSYMNPSAEKRLKVDLREAIGKPLIEWIRSEGLGEVLAGIERVVSLQEPVTINEAVLKSADGSPVAMRLHFAPFCGLEGRLSHILGIGYDLPSGRNPDSVLQDKQSETRMALQRSERFLTQSLEQMNRRNRFLLGLLSLSKEFGAGTSSAMMIEVFQREFPRHFNYPTFRFRMVDEEGIANDETLRKATCEGSTTVLTDLQAHPEYKRLDDRNQSAALVPIAMSERSFGALQVESPGMNQFPEEEVALLEIFARQLAMGLANQRLYEETLALKRYQQSIVESAGAGIIVLDEAANVLSANSTAISMTGVQPDSMVGRPVQEALESDSNAESVGKLMQALAEGRSIHNLEFTKKRLGDASRHLLANLKSFRPEGEAARYLLTLHDLTRVRQMEVQMVQSEKLATLGQMAAGLGHELSNPITFIRSYNELMLANGGLEPQQEGRARKIGEAVERIEELLRNLMAYTRPSDPAERYPVDLSEVIAQLLSFTDYQIRKRGVEVVKRVETGLPKVMANKGLLQQMLINIIENSLHAMPPEGGRLVIGAESIESTSVMVRIEDNGAGIPKELLGRIFTPFFTTKPEGEGTGLGLSIVQQIVAHHNGRISVTSDPERGTRFRVVLPTCELG